MAETDEDITEIKARISNVELKLQSVDEAPLGITIADMREDDDPLVYVNDGFEDITGYTSEEIVGENCRFLQGPETADEPVALMREAIENDEPVRVELRNYQKDGDVFWSEVTLAPLHSADGTVTHYVGFQQDISTRKAYETKLEQQRDDLRVLHEMVRHDIRNDLQVGLASMELLQAEGIDTEQVTAAIESVEQAIELTNTARDIADVMLDSAENRYPVELRSVIQQELDEARERNPDATISVAGTIPAVTVRANDLLDSVFRNLLSNAVTHNDTADSTVQISVQQQDDTVTVVVADDGPGIPDAARDQLFERGWTGTDTGTGMGLYLVDRVLTAYGGSIRLDDDTDLTADLGGATFILTLPVAE